MKFKAFVYLENFQPEYDDCSTIVYHDPKKVLYYEMSEGGDFERYFPNEERENGKN